MRSDVIIVGAPRSGTNILRDVLTALPGFATWPCDEVNLLWKHHNRRIPHDELGPEHVTNQIRRHMRRRFDTVAKNFNASVVVEKTCATSLRVAFAASVMPDAKFIFIRRDGIDAAASAIQRWDAPFDAEYIARKLRYVPLTDMPFYVGQFVSKRLASLRTNGKGLSSGFRKAGSWWGPKPADFLKLQEAYTLEELAIIQWKRCVETAHRQLTALSGERVHEVVYEDFVRQPDACLMEILNFLGRANIDTGQAASRVSDASVGKGRVALGESRIAHLTSLSADTLWHYGYA